ncbi:MAG: hypothetical protein V1720_01745 [bacterium]
MNNKVIRIVSVLMVIYSSLALQAQWNTDPSINNSICLAAYGQPGALVIGDGDHGAIYAWTDWRNGSNTDIYTQKINSAGYTQWTNDGVAICTSSNNQSHLTMTGDGSGGAIMAWLDNRTGSGYDIYAQRINSSGSVQWSANGVLICPLANEEIVPTIVSDGNGGAIIVWADNRNGNRDIFAQKINSSGVIQWINNGVVVCNESNYQANPAATISDGAGGAITSWQDQRNGNADVYSQRISSSGTVQWTANGVAICTETKDQYVYWLTGDGNSGAIIAWHDVRSVTNNKIYAQRVNLNGAVQWTANGILLCTATNSQYYPQMVSDGNGGALLTWMDSRVGASYYDIYAQRIDANGLFHTGWSSDGVAICIATDYQQYPAIASDGNSGAIITWEDRRNGSKWDIYSQRINSSGSVQWTANGKVICSATNNQTNPHITSDENAGAIICWSDARNGTSHIYTSQIDASGNIGTLPVELVSFKANVESESVKLNWQTATEVNNYGFEVERSLNLRGLGSDDGNSNLGGFVSIRFIEGSGTSNSPKESL